MAYSLHQWVDRLFPIMSESRWCLPAIASCHPLSSHHIVVDCEAMVFFGVMMPPMDDDTNFHPNMSTIIILCYHLISTILGILHIEYACSIYRLVIWWQSPKTLMEGNLWEDDVIPLVWCLSKIHKLITFASVFIMMLDISMQGLFNHFSYLNTYSDWCVVR